MLFIINKKQLNFYQMSTIKNQTTATLRQDPSRHYKKRVAAIKDKLPRIYRRILFEHYPEYNCHEGLTLLSNVICLRGSDVRLTEILERIAAGELTHTRAA